MPCRAARTPLVPYLTRVRCQHFNAARRPLTGSELSWRDEGEGAEGSPTLCNDLDDLCRLNERTIMALRPGLLDTLDAMMEDLLGVLDVKGYAMSDVVDVVVPIYGYESIRSALKVLPPIPLPGPEANPGLPARRPD